MAGERVWNVEEREAKSVKSDLLLEALVFLLLGLNDVLRSLLEIAHEAILLAFEPLVFLSGAFQARLRLLHLLLEGHQHFLGFFQLTDELISLHRHFFHFSFSLNNSANENMV